MKKLISIGVVLALLTMAVVPAAVAAYTPPATYSKVPFAIVQSGFELVGNLLGTLQTVLAAAGFALPIDLNDLKPIFTEVGGWAGGPLSWTVDMLAWGLGLAADIAGGLTALGIPDWIPGILDDVACGLMTCWSATNCTGTFTPCA